MSASTWLELEKGIQVPERRGPPQGRDLSAWLTGMRAAFAGRILPFKELAALIIAAMHGADTRSESDAMIAAAAVEHGFTVVTRNLPDFVGTGAKLLNPWAHATIV